MRLTIKHTLTDSREILKPVLFQQHTVIGLIKFYPVYGMVLVLHLEWNTTWIWPLCA
jgi:hypothetical protein